MVPEMGTSGDFDYLGAEADSGDAVDVSDVHSARPAGTSEADLDYLLAEAESGGHDRFDAFDEKTWDYAFTPMPAGCRCRLADVSHCFVDSRSRSGAVITPNIFGSP